MSFRVGVTGKARGPLDPEAEGSSPSPGAHFILPRIRFGGQRLRAKKKPFTCQCSDHKNTDPLFTIGDHTLTIERSLDSSSWFYEADSMEQWRWRCSCGSKGRWQGQSDNVAYHAWENHLRKIGLLAWPRR